MIDPKSITRIYKNEEAVLRQFKEGHSIRGAAVICSVSTKTAHNIYKKYSDQIPKREVQPKPERVQREKTERHWLRVPVNVDQKIFAEADKEGLDWSKMVNRILREWYE